MRKLLNIVGIILLLVLGLQLCENQTQPKEPHLPDLGVTPGVETPFFDPTIRLTTVNGSFFCSGVVIDSAYALTAAHCVTGFTGLSTDKIMIYDVYGAATGITAVPVAYDNYRDLAFIYGDFSNFQKAAVDFKGDDIKDGMSMLACGFPSGEELYCAHLIHSGNYYFQYRTSGGPIFKGQSGGPVFSLKTGRVIGVNSAVSDNNVIIAPLVGSLSVAGFE